VAGALLGTFVGDALGMPYEGLSAAAIPSRLEMVEARRGRGTYTDDTEMMIVLAESLLEHGCVNEESLAEAFRERCDPSRGYGAGTLQVLALWRQGVPVDAAAGRLFDGEGSLGNGAAMRIAPIAVLFADSPDELRAQAERSARLTHAHPLAVDAAIAHRAHRPGRRTCLWHLPADPPRVHQREHGRIHPATMCLCESVALQGFLYLPSPPGPAVHTAVRLKARTLPARVGPSSGVPESPCRVQAGRSARPFRAP
jgi:hypothetical protein